MQFLEYITCTVLLLDCFNTIILYTFHEIILLVHIKMIYVMILRTVVGLKILTRKLLFDNALSDP